MNKNILFLLAALSLTGDLLAQDHFADIGTRAYSNSKDLLVEPEQFKLPNIQVPNKHNYRSIFKKEQNYTDSKSLYKDLAALKEKYRPFLRQLSPDMDVTRKRIDLTSFDWRIANDMDDKDFTYTLSGKGEWEKVNIPHYAPPLGRAVTYYRKEVTFDNTSLNGDAVFICFKGVDYKASVFLNGVFVGNHEGHFAPFEFEVSKYLNEGKNTLLVKVENDFSMLGGVDEKGQAVVGDKIYAASGLGYDEPIEGWHLCPPAMGIHQDCYFEIRNRLHINNIFVRPLLEDSLAEAWIEVNNYSDELRDVKLSLSVYGQNFDAVVVENLEYDPATVHVPGAGDLAKPTDWQRKKLSMGYGPNYLRIPIKMSNVRKWEPDSPWLYQLQVRLLDAEGKLADCQKQHFGMRSFKMDTVNVPKGNMFLNGKQVKLRGANTMGNFMQCVFKKDYDQLISDILLAKLCNMNYIRFTQTPVQSEVYDYCDMLGMMNQTDLPLFGAVRWNQFAEVIKQGGEMERLLRSHPSTVIISYMNERFPNAEGNPQRCINTRELYYKMFSSLTNIVLFNNPDRVIKAADGDYEPPSPGMPDNHCYNIWYNGHGLGLGEMYKGQWQAVKPDWNYGCGEFGSEGLDPLNVMQKYYPKSWLPTNTAENRAWNPLVIPKSQVFQFHHMWFSTPVGIKDWIEKSQEYQASSVKFVTETFRRDNRMMSFAVHLFIDAWPAGWMKTIMDVDRQPKKVYFAYRDALKPLMTSIRSDRRMFISGEKSAFELWISNDYDNVIKEYKLKYQVERGKRVVMANQIVANISACKSEFQGFLSYEMPKVNSRTQFTLRVSLEDTEGKSIAQNSFDFEVFPDNSTIQSKVYLLGDENSSSSEILKEANVNIVSDFNAADVIVVDDYSLYESNKLKLNDLIANGKKMIFLGLKEGKYEISNSSLMVSRTKMGEYYFASPVLNHYIMKNMKDSDFSYWYDSSTATIRPILSYVVEASSEWTPMITSGASTWEASTKIAQVAGEMKYGKGIFRFSEVNLLNKVTENPIAKIYLKNLLDK